MKCKMIAAGFSIVLALSLFLTACGGTSQTPEPESQSQGSSAQAISEYDKIAAEYK